MDYRGIVTQGYHNDAGGQTAIKIISQGYIGTLAELIVANIIRMVSVVMSHPVMGEIALSIPGVDNVVIVVPQ